MPIKRRTSLPPAKQPRPPRDASYHLPGRPLADPLKEYDKAASDAAWNEDLVGAKKHSRLADDIRNRLQAGELYEVDF